MKNPIFLMVSCAAIFPVHGPVQGDVVINEIFYAPPDKTIPEEFVELYNSGEEPVSLVDWYFSDGIDFTFPENTTIQPGEFLVVAQDPAVLKSRHGSAIPAVGPFRGRLDNDGEDLVLMTSGGLVADRVDYQRGFPWPNVGGEDGTSIELIHPDLDNELGGSWRAAGLGSGSPITHYFILPEESDWSYREGVSEPPPDWRQLAFVEDGSWTAGARTSIGYGDGDDNTNINGMSGNYSSLYLRKKFTVEDEELLSYNTRLRIYVDDGAIVWINDREVGRFHVSEGDKDYNDMASNHEAAWEEMSIRDPRSYLQVGENIIAVHVMNSSLSSSDLSIDVSLLIPEDHGGSVGDPTPGAQNSVYATNAPPQIRKVQHSPKQPAADEEVAITALVTDPDGVSRVSLHYQIVDPGSYIPILLPNMSPNPEYSSPLNWDQVEMYDDGISGDETAGDHVYTAVMPAGLQKHRRLIRYTIELEDAKGLAVTVPYPDDPQPNFAYFCYNGVPSWRGAFQPGSSAVVTYDEEVMNSIPVYHLISREEDVLNCQYNSAYDNGVYRFAGTIVYEGEVYDHVLYRIKGQASTFRWGKNKWKFNFNRGHSFQARDDYGRKYRRRWDKLNLGTGACPWWQYPHHPFGNPSWDQGTGGMVMNETLAFKFYNLAGVPACKTNYFHFRVIDDAMESGPTQYDGDFWGLYFTIEQGDSNFLDEHDLPDGNIYKMDGSPTLLNQGSTQVTNYSDINGLTSSSTGYNKNPPQPYQWWMDNINMPAYFNYNAISLAVNNSDPRPQQNCLMYHNSGDGRWIILPWDLDLTFEWGTHYTDWEHLRYSLAYTEFEIENKNRDRELMDLLFNGEQANQVIDEMASFIWNSDGSPSFADANRALWDYHPRKNYKGWFFKNNEYLETRDFPGLLKYYKKFLTAESFYHPSYPQYMYGGKALSDSAEDPLIPFTPALQYRGDPGFPVDGLAFRSEAFRDPNGDQTFGALKWRVAEVAPPGGHAFAGEEPPPYEIHAIWEREELNGNNLDVVIPWWAVTIGHTYRARVRMMDATGRWSHWSEPIEFLAGAPVDPGLPQFSLRITEVMYHPADLDPFDDDRLEFIELFNSGSSPVDLSGYRFGEGVQFSFPAGTVLQPQEYLVIVRDVEVFSLRYDTSNIRVLGNYDGRLDNGGEMIELLNPLDEPVVRFQYDDRWYESTDGEGYSLVLVDSTNLGADWSRSSSWMPSRAIHGSPGKEDGALQGGLQLPGDANQDGVLDIADCLALVFALFGDHQLVLPCQGTSMLEGNNLVLLDANGDSGVDLSDCIHILSYLFRQGIPPMPGSRCIRLEDCQSSCVQ